MTPIQYRSHADLLARPVRGQLSLGGIVVPATRDPAALTTVMRLSAALDAPLIVMCSGEARPHEVIERASAVKGARCTAVDFRGLDVRDMLPGFKTSEFPEAINHSYGDLSLKRNLGLLIGRLAGWPSLLFLDDDIRGVRAATVRQAIGSLDQHAAVSGSALAVNVQRADSFFPEIYNEDWLFLAPHVDRRRVSSHGQVRQDFYNPFDDPERAARQEFGDVLAEGIYSHLHRGTLDRPPAAGHWNAFMENRATLIQRATDHFRRQTAFNPVARDALRSLTRAQAAHTAIRARTLVDYIAAWQSDLDVWRRHLAQLPRPGSVESALNQLGLSWVSVASSPRTSAAPLHP